jgi:hypothetical protein
MKLTCYALAFALAAAALDAAPRIQRIQLSITNPVPWRGRRTSCCRWPNSSASTRVSLARKN